eukprot:scaffold6503_cov115-Isochrysis_galbana.AAC.5
MHNEALWARAMEPVLSAVDRARALRSAREPPEFIHMVSKKNPAWFSHVARARRSCCSPCSPLARSGVRGFFVFAPELTAFADDVVNGAEYVVDFEEELARPVEPEGWSHHGEMT